MQTLLEKTRRMNQRLSMAASEVDFDSSAKVIRDSARLQRLCLDKMGRILGYALQDDFECVSYAKDILSKNEFPASYNERLFRQNRGEPEIRRVRLRRGNEVFPRSDDHNDPPDNSRWGETWYPPIG